MNGELVFRDAPYAILKHMVGRDGYDVVRMDEDGHRNIVAAIYIAGHRGLERAKQEVARRKALALVGGNIVAFPDGHTKSRMQHVEPPPAEEEEGFFGYWERGAKEYQITAQNFAASARLDVVFNSCHKSDTLYSEGLLESARENQNKAAVYYRAGRNLVLALLGSEMDAK